MTLTRQRFLRLAACGSAGVAASALGLRAAAQAAPTRIVVGFPPGATTDLLARALGEHLSATLRQTVLVENKPGAGGRIANELVKAAAADSSTLLVTPVATMSIFPHSYAGQLRYDPFKDFAPVAHLCNFQLGFGVGTRVPAATLGEYVEWVRSDPARNGFYGSAAPGSIPHFFGVMFARSAGINLTHVPYKGTAAAMSALAGGEIAALSTVAADLRTLVDAGRARLLAVAGERRDEMFAKVPTFREQGFDLVASPWYGLFAPAGTPPERVRRIADAVAAMTADASLRKRLVDMGVEPTGLGPDALAAVMKRDFERWGPVVRDSGFKASD